MSIFNSSRENFISHDVKEWRTDGQTDRKSLKNLDRYTQPYLLTFYIYAISRVYIYLNKSSCGWHNIVIYNIKTTYLCLQDNNIFFLERSYSTIPNVCPSVCLSIRHEVIFSAFQDFVCASLLMNVVILVTK